MKVLDNNVKLKKSFGPVTAIVHDTFFVPSMNKRQTKEIQYRNSQIKLQKLVKKLAKNFLHTSSGEFVNNENITIPMQCPSGYIR